MEALAYLESKLREGQVVPERVNRALAGFECFAKGRASALGTRRYQEIQQNMRI